MGCITCEMSVEETWEHFISCDPNNDIWPNLHSSLIIELRALFTTHAHKDLNNFQIEHLILSLIGASADSVMFHLFKQIACEGKITQYFSDMIRNKLHLSPTIGVKVDAFVLLIFLHLFKSLIWIP